MRRVLKLAAFVALPLVFLLALVPAVAPPAGAVTVGPGGQAFYNAPSPIPPVAHGTLLSYRPTTVSLGPGAPAVGAWDLLDRSTDSNGDADVVTGTLLVPTAPWVSGFFGIGATPRPLIAYAPGTQGLAQRCAPSEQLTAGTEYEAANIVALLQKNWAVVVTDYAGYTNGATPTYLAGRSEGQAVLDAALAAPQVPGAGVSASATTAVWGYSQGGQAADWAGQLSTGYAPSLHLAGVSAGGVPGDFEASAANLDGSVGAAFLLMGVQGLATEYPADIPFAALENAAARSALAAADSECVFQTLFQFADTSIRNFNAAGLSLQQLEAIPPVGATLVAQNLGTAKIPVPVLQYHGQSDEFIPLGQALALKNRYCSLGTNVQFELYPGEHITTQFQAAPQVVSWLGDRLSGLPQLGNCLEPAPSPASTANPGGGDLVVSLKNWTLGGSVTVHGLGQSLSLPPASTFSATTDLTTQKLTGALSVPTIASTISILGIPVNIQVSLTPSGATSGSVSLDANGQLHIHGATAATVDIVSAGDLGINIPLGCQTSTPVQFPLNFDGPVSSLGDGGLTFSGTTTFPSLTGCGLLSPLLSLLFSGAGNTSSFTVAPPAPVAW